MTWPCFPPGRVTEFHRIAVLGPGVLGGSIALALRKRCPEESLVLWARNKMRADEVRCAGLPEVTTSLAEAVGGADLVILAVPVDSLEELGRELLNVGLRDGVCITDVGSVKVYPHQSLGRLMERHNIVFIGSHPMAGSERSGFTAADADLFVDAACILTNEHQHSESLVALLGEFWAKLGAAVSVMGAEEHDRLVGRISHLPHVLSTVCALSALKNLEDGRYSGQGLRDTSRVAGGEPSMWAEILLQNRAQIAGPLREAAQELSKIAEHLDNEDRGAILEALRSGQSRRRTLDREE